MWKKYESRNKDAKSIIICIARVFFKSVEKGAINPPLYLESEINNLKGLWASAEATKLQTMASKGLGVWNTHQKKGRSGGFLGLLTYCCRPSRDCCASCQTAAWLASYNPQHQSDRPMTALDSGVWLPQKWTAHLSCAGTWHRLVQAASA